MRLVQHSVVGAFILAMTLLGCGNAAPKNQQRITDEAGVLSGIQRREIDALLSAHDKIGPGRIAVLMVNKLPAGMTIETFAVARINQPPPARNEKLDRVLLAIALEDRKMRIETSREMSTVLPDGFCKRVIEQTIAPQFKEKKYFEGIREGVSALIKQIEATK